jgi:glycosyltransferase involved in cell wall biosynthesis
MSGTDTAPGGFTVGVIIPALNEERALPHVLTAIPRWVARVIVADNGSTDATADVARAHGAHVVHVPMRGYGRACLAAIASLPADIDVVVFIDGDASDAPEEMAALLAPLELGTADFVVGSRMLGKRERGSLTPQQIFGNGLACLLMRLIWGARFTDLGPFRAIRTSTLHQLEMADGNYGWTVEMQIKAAHHGIPSTEVPVSYKRRIGVSKVSGTVRGVIGAGTKILYVIGREAIAQVRHKRRGRAGCRLAEK